MARQAPTLSTIRWRDSVRAPARGPLLYIDDWFSLGSAALEFREEGERAMRRMIGLVSIVALGFCLTAAGAEDKTPDGTLKLSGGSVAAGVGVSWASGTLNYKGKEYPIDVKGLSVGDVGMTKLEASGKVYDLKTLDDFNGNFTAVGTGLAAAGGAGAAVMKNQNGVTVELVSTTQGAKVAIGAGGVSMKIKQ
jgi:hypothetical protein